YFSEDLEGTNNALLEGDDTTPGHEGTTAEGSRGKETWNIRCAQMIIDLKDIYILTRKGERRRYPPMTLPTHFQDFSSCRVLTNVTRAPLLRVWLVCLLKGSAIFRS
ncbi:hypothetical protein, partial [Lonepinella koalarum]|uniref:hypothetical protein n=1 Tax=Lonepinella koalarum TaxID=53417 RepID=UPI001ADD9C27